MASEDPNNVAGHLRTFRRRVRPKLTQERLAELSGLSAATVSALERGVERPYRDTLERLANALGLSVDERAQLEGARAVHDRPEREPEERQTLNNPATTPHNLPESLTSLVGRDEALADLAELVVEHRLVTLVGTGGVGKSRIAIEAGRAARSTFADGVFFIDLAPLVDATLLGTILAAVLGVSGTEERPIVESVLAGLRQQHALLVLDSCERIVADVAAFVERVVQACPRVHVLATSQQTLNVDGELVYEILPLTYPSVNERPDPTAYLRHGAVALFVDRARAADRRFILNAENAKPVAEICRRVDGVALCVELAASHTRVLSPSVLAQRLEKRLPFLSRGRRGAPARHRTLRALFEWSDQLLSNEERLVLRRVAVFSGGWTIESAEAVCTDDFLDAARLFAALTSLVDKSQVVTEQDGSARRYRLLDSMREYALEKLDASGERETVSRRHGEWVASFVSALYEARWELPRHTWLQAISPEANNARAALAWLRGPGNAPHVAARIAVGMGGYWYDRGLGTEGRGWLEDLLADPVIRADQQLYAPVLLALSTLLFGPERADAARGAVEAFDSIGNARGLTLAKMHLAIALRQMTQFSEAVEAIDESIALFKANGFTHSVYYASALGWRASALVGLKRYDEARQLYEEDVLLYELLGDRERAAVERLNLAELEFDAGDLDRAISLISEASLILEREAVEANRLDDLFLAAGQLNLTAYLIVLREIDRARHAAELGLSRAVRVQYPIYTTLAIQHVATLAALGGQSRIATRLKRYVDHFYNSRQLNREPTEKRLYDLLSTALATPLKGPSVLETVPDTGVLSEAEAIELSQTFLARRAA